MIGAARRFDELMIDLLLRRESEPLAQDQESASAAELQRCWDAMTDEQQADAQHAFLNHQPNAPPDLGLQDVNIALVTRALPRKTA